MWPLLVPEDIDVPSSDILGLASALHRDRSTVTVDVERSMWAFARGWSAAELSQRRAELERVLNAAVTASDTRYFQGLHDVASVLLLTLGEVPAAALLARLLRGHLRDASRPGLEPALENLCLLPVLLGLADRTFYAALRGRLVGVDFDERLAARRARVRASREHRAAPGSLTLLDALRGNRGGVSPSSGSGARRPGGRASPRLERGARRSARLVDSGSRSSSEGDDGCLSDISLPDASEDTPGDDCVLPALLDPPVWALPWTLTWFSHGATGDDALDQVARLFDLFLASHPLMPIYVGAAALTERSTRRRIIKAATVDSLEAYSSLRALKVPDGAYDPEQTEQSGDGEPDESDERASNRDRRSGAGLGVPPRRGGSGLSRRPAAVSDEQQNVRAGASGTTGIRDDVDAVCPRDGGETSDASSVAPAEARPSRETVKGAASFAVDGEASGTAAPPLSAEVAVDAPGPRSPPLMATANAPSTTASPPSAPSTPRAAQRAVGLLSGSGTEGDSAQLPALGAEGGPRSTGSASESACTSLLSEAITPRGDQGAASETTRPVEEVALESAHSSPADGPLSALPMRSVSPQSLPPPAARPSPSLVPPCPSASLSSSFAAHRSDAREHSDIASSTHAMRRLGARRPGGGPDQLTPHPVLLSPESSVGPESGEESRVRGASSGHGSEPVRLRNDCEAESTSTPTGPSRSSTASVARGGSPLRANARSAGGGGGGTSGRASTARDRRRPGARAKARPPLEAHPLCSDALAIRALALYARFKPVDLLKASKPPEDKERLAVAPYAFLDGSGIWHVPNAPEPLPGETPARRAVRLLAEAFLAGGKPRGGSASGLGSRRGAASRGVHAHADSDPRRRFCDDPERRARERRSGALGAVLAASAVGVAFFAAAVVSSREGGMLGAFQSWGGI